MTSQKTNPVYFKYLSLFIIFIVPLIFYGIKYASHGAYRPGIFISETIVWILFFLVLIIAKYGEKEPIIFTETGIGIIKSIGLSFLILLSILIIVIIYGLIVRYVLKIQTPHEALRDTLHNYPIGARIMLCIRAGVVEETFFRAYAMSRIKQLTKNNFLAFSIPLVYFAAGHFAYGTLNHVIGAFLIGLVLALYYVKTKNLLANVLAHSFYDSIALVFLKSGI